MCSSLNVNEILIYFTLLKAYAKSLFVFLCIEVMIILYVPVSVIGFFVFRGKADNKQGNIISNLNDGWIRKTVEVLITGHILSAFNLVLNAVYQGAEKFFKVPNGEETNNKREHHAEFHL